MSFDLIVYYPESSTELARKWRAALERHGKMRCEFPPDFSLNEHTGFVTVRRSAKPSRDEAQKPKRPPEDDVAAGFELSMSAFNPSSELLAELDETRENININPAITQARWIAVFTTPIGRTQADYQAQWLAAATLAEVTGGLLVNPQDGAEYAEGTALAVAKRARLPEPHSTGN